MVETTAMKERKAGIKTIQGIVIDPRKRTIERVALDNSLQGIYQAMSNDEHAIDCIASAGYLTVNEQDEDVCYVDDNGLLIGGNPLWLAAWYPYQLLAGTALIIGCTPDGDNCNTRLSVYAIASLVNWTDRLT